MNKINAMVVGSLATIAIIGFLGLTTVQLIYAQDSATTTTEDLNTLITTTTGIISTIAVLAGGIIASFAKMSKNLGLTEDKDIDKMLYVARELEGSDRWCKELEERLVAVAEVISELPEGKKVLESKRVDLARWKDDASKLDNEISTIYKDLLPLIRKK